MVRGQGEEVLHGRYGSVRGEKNSDQHEENGEYRL